MQLYGSLFYVERKERLRTLYKTFKQPIILLITLKRKPLRLPGIWVEKKEILGFFLTYPQTLPRLSAAIATGGEIIRVDSDIDFKPHYDLTPLFIWKVSMGVPVLYCQQICRGGEHRSRVHQSLYNMLNPIDGVKARLNGGPRWLGDRL